MKSLLIEDLLLYSEDRSARAVPHNSRREKIASPIFQLFSRANCTAFEPNILVGLLHIPREAGNEGEAIDFAWVERVGM